MTAAWPRPVDTVDALHSVDNLTMFEHLFYKYYFNYIIYISIPIFERIF